MIYKLLAFFHVLSIVVWVGGMFFAHFALRPAVTGLDTSARLPLMLDVLQRFFAVVLVAAPVAVITGLWMIGRVARQAAEAGGNFGMPLGWTFMATFGIVMLLIFGHIRFALFRRLQRAVQGQDTNVGIAALGSIRQWVFANLVLGLLAIASVYLV